MVFFREDYFIDSVDHEYALRARQHGYQIWISTRVLAAHFIGRQHTSHRHSLLQIPEHSALRKYYIFRNCITTVLLYFWQEPVWCLRQFCRLTVEIIAIIIYESDKKAKLFAILLGISHAFLGKMGPLTN